MIGALSPWRSARPASTVSQTWQEHLRHTGVPGGAYAVITSQGTRERTASGVDGNGRPWTERTPTLWGSISKPIAASVADAAISRGELRVTDPITEHLSLADCSAAQRVTVADLVHHTSGVGAALTALDRGSTRDATQVVHDNARDLCPTTDPGTYRYSSANYLALAAVLESATGRTFPELLRSHLGPTGATGLVTGTDAAEAMPAGHRVVAGQPVASATPYDESGLAYSYLGGSLTDLEDVARGFLGAAPALGSPTSDAGVATGSPDRYGAGWRIRDLPDGSHLAWHSGTVPGYVTTMMLWPERDLALVTLQNASGVGQAESLLAGPIRLATGLVPETTLTAQDASPLYPGGLALLGGLAVLTWAAALLRPSGSRLALLGWIAAAVSVLALVATHLGTGSVGGIPWRQAWLWAPDAAGLAAATGAAFLLGAARALSAGRASRTPPSPRRGSPRRGSLRAGVL